jgi:hypothetical protein
VSSEYGYRMPASVPAGLVRVELRNAGTDVHEALLVRFRDSAGSAGRYVDSVRANVDFPAFATDVGGPGLTLPGRTTAIWLELAPGRYAVVCWKGDHLRLGMAHDLTVTDRLGRRRELPIATAEITLADYTFGLSRPLTAGHQVLHLRNVGQEAHEADLFRLEGGATVEDYARWLDEGEVGRPPVDPVGGIGDLVPGREIWLEANLRPGRYFFLCQIKARSDSRPHYRHGMVLEFTVM